MSNKQDIQKIMEQIDQDERSDPRDLDALRNRLDREYGTWTEIQNSGKD